MTKRVRLGLLLVLTNAALIVPALVLPASRFDSAGGLISIGTLAVLIVAATRGLISGLLAAVFLGATSALAIAASTSLSASVALMIGVAVAQGVSARRGLNRITMTIPITVAFVINEPPTEGALSTPLLFGLALTGVGVIVSLLVAAIDRGAPTPTGYQSIDVARASAYTVLLSATTVVTTVIALSGDWGHTGGWLIMTPFIVIQPYVQDGWRKALARAAGTVAGFVIAAVLAELIGSPTVLTVIGFGFATIAVIAMTQKWHYAVYAALLTPAIVLLESGGRAVEQLAEKRLEATLLGVGLAMIAMAIAIPIYRKQARNLGLTKY